MLSTDGPSGGGTLALFGSFFYILLVMGFIILFCYFILRLMGRVKGRGGASGNLQLMESIVVGSQNMVQLVRAGDKYLVIGVTKEQITVLAELDETQVKAIEPLPPIRDSFKKILERYMPSGGGAKDEMDDRKDE
ncbi:MAG: flagellar biosynthetic protein FliO [Defluviitaleaceae bacterium]|nr:flagellar biosynthetic protein FliO [Defluviitaleaceae bacterium]